jgi:hypothetical protein
VFLKSSPFSVYLYNKLWLVDYAECEAHLWR